MDTMNNIIQDLMQKHMIEIENHVIDAFQKHFNVSINSIDPREIERVKVEGNPIESFRYHGETFLLMQDIPGGLDIKTDRKGASVILTTQYKEV